jgi:teichuronic acid biosynthesis glycosyltransferase TuaH
MITDIVGRDIIIISQQAWDTEIGSNCKDIALELSKTNRVLYVNSPLNRITRIRHRNRPEVKKRLAILKGKKDGLERINDNLWTLYPDCMIESINWINNKYIFDFLNKKNNEKFAQAIKKGIRAMGFKRYILFNDNEIFKGLYLKEALRPDLSIYYSRDYILAVDYWKKHGRRLEPLIIAKYDLCMANSTYLTDYCKKFNSNSFYIGQGCDLKIFQNVKGIPEELKKVKRPIIGYVGALQSIRLDIRIIAHIASSCPDWTIVLVGPEDEKFKSSILHQFENIVFLGLKPLAELPYYINAFDVCINPQLVNDLTIGNYPRKIDEYLALGKPVVATKTRAMDIFADYVYLASNANEYVELIRKVLAEDTEILHEERKNFAFFHSWENCVKQMYNTIDMALSKDASESPVC